MVSRQTTEEALLRTRNWPKRLAKSILWCVAGFFLLIVILVAIFQIPSVRTGVKDRLVGYLSRYVNARVSIGAITGDFFNGIELEKLRVTTVDGDILSLERLSLGYSIPLIFDKTVFVREAHFHGLRVSFVSHADGSSNFSDLIAPVEDDSEPEPSTPSGFRLVIGTLVLEDSGFAMTHNDPSGDLWKGVNIDRLAARFTYGEEIKIEILESAVSLNEPVFPHLVVNGTAVFDPEDLRLDLHRIDVRSGDSFLQLTGALRFDGETPSFEAQLSLDPVSLPELKTGFSIDADVEGALRGSVTAKGDFSRFSHRIDLIADASSLKLEGVVEFTSAGGVALDVSGAARRINPAKTPFGSFTDEGGDINADFEIDALFPPDTAPIEGTVAVDFLPSQSPWARIVKGNITAALSNKRLKINGLELVTEMGAIRTTGTVQMNQDDILVRDTTLSTPFGALQLEGSLSNVLLPDAGKQFKAKMSLRELNPAVFLDEKKLQGQINLDLRIEADLPPDMDIQKGHATLAVHASPSQMGGIALSSGKLLAQWKNERLGIESFEIDTDHGKVRTGGELAPFQRTGHLRTDADLNDLSQIYKTLGTYFPDVPPDLRLTGAVQLHAVLAGSLDAAELSLTCTGRDVGVMDVAATSLQLSGKRKGSLLSAEGVSTVDLDLLDEGRNRLTLKGEVESLKEGAQHIAIEALSLAAPKIPMLEALDNQGPIRLLWRKGELLIGSLRMQSGEAALSLTGTLSGTGKQDLRLELVNLELSRLNRLWKTRENVSGLVSATAVVGGTMASPVIEANITGEKLSGYQMTGTALAADLNYADSKAHVSVLLSKNGNKRLEARGTITSDPQFIPFMSELSKSRLDFSIQTSGLRLSDLPIPNPRDMVFDAAATVDMRVSGEASLPEIKGNIKLTDGYLTLLKNGLTYETMTATISFTGETLEVEELFLKGDTEGYLRGAGTIHLKGVSPEKFDLSLSGEDFFIPYRKAITARITPRLKLSGSSASPVLSGEVSVGESKINLDRMAGPSAPEIQIIRSSADSEDERRVILDEKPSDFMNALAAGVTIKVPKNAWLKGQDISTEIAGEIGLRKESGKPFWLLGALNTRRGTYYFRGKHFNIEEGAVEFIGLEDPNPNINIKAVSRIQEVDIIIHISGTARKLVLALDSDPQMDQSDIISYLVFGKPTDSLKGGQAFNAEKAAMSFSGGLLAAELRGILGDVIFLDAFGVESGENGGGAVSVGKYIRPNIFMTYRYGLAEDEPNQVEISYEYNSNIRVETQLGNDKNSGVDLFWQIDF